VGKSASAAFVTLAKGMISLYVSLLMQHWIQERLGSMQTTADWRGLRAKTDKGKRIERKAARGKGSSGEKGKIG
jgi:hypothetical protein